jgi:hypothetical protein
VFLHHALAYTLSSIHPQQQVGRNNTLISIAHPLISENHTKNVNSVSKILNKISSCQASYLLTQPRKKKRFLYNVSASEELITVQTCAK